LELFLVELDRVDGLKLHVSEVDVLNETPLLNIKPYVSKFDIYKTKRNGWLDTVGQETIEKNQADKRFQHES
jgi:tRNA (adenine37-N6)-methyltransferase